MLRRRHSRKRGGVRTRLKVERRRRAAVGHLVEAKKHRGQQQAKEKGLRWLRLRRAQLQKEKSLGQMKQTDHQEAAGTRRLKHEIASRRILHASSGGREWLLSAREDKRCLFRPRGQLHARRVRR